MSMKHLQAVSNSNNYCSVKGWLALSLPKLLSLSHLVLTTDSLERMEFFQGTRKAKTYETGQLTQPQSALSVQDCLFRQDTWASVPTGRMGKGPISPLLLPLLLANE